MGMWTLIRSLTAPFFSLVLLILANGLCNTFISLRLELEGYERGIIGLVTSSLYIGIFFGSIWIDRIITKLGLINSFIVFTAVSTVLILISLFG